MRTSAEIRAWLRSALEETGLSVVELAQRSGVARSTIHRALDENYEFVPSTRTLDKLTIALVDAGIEEGLKARAQAPDAYQDFMPVSLEICAGRWRENEDVDYSGYSPLVFNERVSRQEQFVGRISDNSANEAYAAGDLVHIVGVSVFSTLTISRGDHLIVSRHRRSTGGTEFRLYEVVTSDEKSSVLRAPTGDPSLQHSLTVYEGKDVSAQDLQVAVFGIVIARYRATHWLAQ